jgi:hypothetical protein
MISRVVSEVTVLEAWVGTAMWCGILAPPTQQNHPSP